MELQKDLNLEFYDMDVKLIWVHNYNIWTKVEI